MSSKNNAALDLLPEDKANGSVNYAAMERERTAYLQADLDARLQAEAAVKGHSLQKLILKSVVVGDYSKAKDDINHFVTYKSVYPSYPRKVKRHVRHCNDLIDAIKVKRNFPGLSTMSMSKQKEIMDHVVSHFDELKQSLKLMEKMASEVVLSDLRSTVWAVRTVSYVVVMLVLTSFFINFEKEVGVPIWIHFNVMADELFDKIWKLF